MPEKPGKYVGPKESEKFSYLEDMREGAFSGWNSITLDYLGWEQGCHGYDSGPCVRENLVLHMVVSGRGALIKNEKAYEIEAGQAFLTCPGENAVYRSDDQDPWSYMWLGFHGVYAESMMSRIGFTKNRPVVTCANMEKLKDSMEKMLRFKEPGYAQTLNRLSVFYQLLAQLSENAAQEKEHKEETTNMDYEYVQSAIQLLLKSSNSSVRVSDVAKTIGISRNYLTNIFKQQTGVSPQEFLMNQRMKDAASLLALSRDPIHVIAMKVGYHDSLTFSKAFKKRYGLSPTEYRR